MPKNLLGFTIPPPPVAAPPLHKGGKRFFASLRMTFYFIILNLYFNSYIALPKNYL